MSDTKANVNITSAIWGQDIYLYTHWEGHMVLDNLKEALKRGTLRWRDPPYLARIVFCQMVRGKEMEITGFGISALAFEGPIYTLDIDKQVLKYDDKVIEFAEFVKDVAEQNKTATL